MTPEVTTPQVASSTPAAPSSSAVAGSVTPTTTSATPAERVLAHLNAARAKEGLPPLTMDPALVTAGERHNQAMTAGCGLSHRCSGEADLGDRITAAGAGWSPVGENVAMGGPVANSWSPASPRERCG